MHELSITRSVVAIVTEAAHGRRVRRVSLEIGALSAIVPDSVRFCFDVVAAGTPLEGAELAIRTVPAAARCRACGTRFEATSPIAICACGSREVTLSGGEELKVLSIEVAEEMASCA